MSQVLSNLKVHCHILTMSLPGIYPHFHFNFFNVRLSLLRYFSNDLFCSGFSTTFFTNLFLHSLLRNQSVSLSWRRWQLSYLLDVFLCTGKNFKILHAKETCHEFTSQNFWQAIVQTEIGSSWIFLISWKRNLNKTFKPPTYFSQC